MSSRFLMLTVLLTLFPAIGAQAGQPVVSGGKGDLQQVPGTNMEAVALEEIQPFHVSDVEVSQFANKAYDIQGLSTPSDVDDITTPADVIATIRYNIERLEVEPDPDYNWDRFVDQTYAIKWDIAAAVGLMATIGLSDWNWGSQSFHFTNEGWFGEDTKYLGVDKLGHAYSGYLLTEYFTQRIAHSDTDRAGAALTGAVLGMGIQTYVEILDGFSDNGFSGEDFVVDGIGVGFSVLRSHVPGLANKLDFRMEYVPSGNDGAFKPFHDYSGQKYLLALKLSGFENLEDTPLRFVELQAGYFARGFTDAEQERGDDIRREPYVAVAFNLQELLDGGPMRDTLPSEAARRALEYVQLPYTYVASTQN